MTISTVTTKGQVTIPKHIRNLLNIDKGDRVEFLVDNNGAVTIWPITTDVTELKGLVSKPDKYVSLKDMKNAIQNQGGRY
jgi:AbrB family looped-hinge helix DNA binding protein